MNKVWLQFAWKVGAWLAAALLVHFLTTIFLGGPPEYVVPGILVLGALHIGLLDRTPLPVGEGRLLKRGVAIFLATFAYWVATDGAAQDGISWVTYSEDAVEGAHRGGRPVLIDFSLRNCPPCLAMDRKVFSKLKVIKAAEPFLALRVDLAGTNEPNAAVAAKYAVGSYPTVVFLGADGQERRNQRLEGYEDPLSFAQRLELAR